MKLTFGMANRSPSLGLASLANQARKQPGGITGGVFDVRRTEDPNIPYGSAVVANAAYNASVRAPSAPGKFASLIARRSAK